jgi:hypothetical protein
MNAAVMQLGRLQLGRHERGNHVVRMGGGAGITDHGNALEAQKHQSHEHRGLSRTGGRVFQARQGVGGMVLGRELRDELRQ